MPVLQPVMISLLNSWLTRPQKSGHSKLAGLWLLAMSCLLACAGLIYLLITLNSWIETYYGPTIAALGTALAAFLLSGLASAGYVWLERPKPVAQNEDSLIKTAEELIAAVERATEGLDEPIAKNPRTSMALASLAGYVTANKMH
jgi:hypothetical protein